MYYNVRSKTKNKEKIERFEDYLSINIINIKNIISNNNYIPGKYNIFIIREPKIRVIMSQSMKDKVINHLVSFYFLIYVFDRHLVDNNIATRIGKGTHYGLKLFKNYYNKFKNKYNKFYVLKFDIKKYFYNIDHNIVKNLIKRKIKDKKVLKIIYSIIDSTDEDYINKRIYYLREKYHIDIPIYRKGKGLPIGNMSSQVIACFYLDELDKMIMYDLGIREYIRYMDDGVLFYKDKEYLRFCLKRIEELVHKYKLELNSKTKIYASSEQIEFIGFCFLTKNDKIIMKVNNKTKRKFKNNINELNKSSYMGHLSYGDCGSLMNSVLGGMKNEDNKKEKKDNSRN